MKKILIILLFVLFSANSFAMIYSETAIMLKESQNFTLSMNYEDEDICNGKKDFYNKKFPLYFRGNCFKREKDAKYYYFISKKKVKKIQKKKKGLDQVSINQFIGKYVAIENLSKFTHLINNYSSGGDIKKSENRKIEIAQGELYLLNIYDDVDFVMSMKKITNGMEIKRYYNKNIYEIKKHLDKFRKTKKCSFDIINVNPELKSFLYKNNIYIKTKKLNQNLACYIYKNKANYYYRNLCTVYHKYRETNIKKGLYSMKLSYPIIRAQSEVNTLRGLFSNGVKYVEGLALRTKRDKKGKLIKGKIETFKVDGGGLCGVATIFYHFAMYEPDLFTVTKRWPHMGYYRGYYGPTIGLDATIYGPVKNFRFANKTGESMIWDYYGYRKGNKFCYGVQAWKLNPFPKEAVINSKKYKKNCYKNTVFDPVTRKVKKSTYSCYKEIGW